MIFKVVSNPNHSVTQWGAEGMKALLWIVSCVSLLGEAFGSKLRREKVVTQSCLIVKNFLLISHLNPTFTIGNTGKCFSCTWGVVRLWNLLPQDLSKAFGMIWLYACAQKGVKAVYARRLRSWGPSYSELNCSSHSSSFRLQGKETS